MANDPRRVIVRREEGGTPARSCAHVHHVDFPELWAEADTPDQGARRLADRLRDARDWSCEPRRREALGGALAEVEEFLRHEIVPVGARP